MRTKRSSLFLGIVMVFVVSISENQ
ncbi:hypothetical protein J0654_05495 [Muricauda lutimaris]|uniref:Uncharacterized protein n=1 Tax=Flagellimonas profundi TaxID=2915620 RepID=A0ABS3FD67_9FLAO|nr:hypothetical protein [Allomuricauda profundi]